MQNFDNFFVVSLMDNLKADKQLILRWVDEPSY